MAFLRRACAPCLGLALAFAAESTAAAQDARAADAGDVVTEGGPGATSTTPALPREMSDEEIAQEALAWRVRRPAEQVPVGWAHSAEFVDPIGLELGARALVGVMTGDPWGLRGLDPTLATLPSWGGRAHIGVNFGAVSLRVEAGYVRHEVAQPLGVMMDGLAVTEIPLSLHLRLAPPSPLASVLLEIGAGVSRWTIPLRLTDGVTLEQIDNAWTPRGEISLGLRLFMYLDVLATAGMVLPPDLSGTGDVFDEVAYFVGGSLGFVFGVYR